MVDRSYPRQDKTRQLDPSKKGKVYFRNAVERHWDPYEIDFADDVDGVLEMVDEYGERSIDRMLNSLSAFTVGEEAVVDDLMPIAKAVDDIEDEIYLTTQMYEEAKHTEFFDRYWDEVIWTVEDEIGRERTTLYNEDQFAESYWEMFEKLEADTELLLEEPSSENLARAICTYHLALEGIGAQGGYYSMHAEFGELNKVPELPHLPGLDEGFRLIRQDEGRHVGWGMHKLKSMIADGEVTADLVRDQVDYIMGYLAGPQEDDEFDDIPQLPAEDFQDYVLTKHQERMRQIVDASEEIPDIDSLTNIRHASES